MPPFPWGRAAGSENLHLRRLSHARLEPRRNAGRRAGAVAHLLRCQGENRRRAGDSPTRLVSQSRGAVKRVVAPSGAVEVVHRGVQTFEWRVPGGGESSVRWGSSERVPLPAYPATLAAPRSSVKVVAAARGTPSRAPWKPIPGTGNRPHPDQPAARLPAVSRLPTDRPRPGRDRFPACGGSAPLTARVPPHGRSAGSRSAGPPRF